MKWIGQHIWDFVSRFRSDVYLEDVDTGTITSGGNLGLDSNNKIVKATISSGSGDITGVTITTDSGAVNAASQTSGSADFSIVGTSGVGVTNSSEAITVTSVPGEIDHDSLDNFVANEHIDWTTDQGSTNIHSGNYTDTVPTLSNVNALDITEVGTISSGAWQGDAIASAYLDADTAHLTVNQTFTGKKTFTATIKQDGDQNLASGDGAALHIDSSDITDTATSASGTAAKFTTVNIEPGRLLASNLSVTTTDAATLYVAGAPIASTNQTITRNWSMWVDAGNARFDGSIYSGTTEAINSSGVIQVATQGTIDHDSLANFVANEHIDWTTDQGSTNIHTGNYVNTEYTEATTDAEGLMSSAHHDKLDGIEDAADVTDATNVTAAGALMDSELTDLAGVKGMTVANKANVASPTFTGTPAAPTAAAGTNTTQIATTAHVKASIDERFTYQYISFTGNANVATNWAIPSTNGPAPHNWSTSTGVSGTAVDGSVTSSQARSKQNGFVVPFDDCVLVGFYGLIRNNSSNTQGALGLFHNTFGNFGANSAASTITLRAYGAASTAGGFGSTYQGFCVAKSMSVNLALDAGDIVIPAILQASHKAYAQFTIVIKTPIL